MKRSSAASLLGVLLVCLGVVFLLQNFGIIHDVADKVWGIFWALAFGVGGLAFVAVFAADRTNWWAIIPGFTLLGLAGLIGIGTLFPSLAEPAASLFLLAIALSFWVIFLTHRENWWAVIPAGVMTTIAVIVGFTSVLGEDTNGNWVPSVLFLGLAATFALIYFLPTTEGRMKWAVWPAAVLGVMGLMFTIFAGGLVGILWPLALVAGGLLLVLRTLRTREL